MEEDKELFEDYEIKGWDGSPKMYKIIGAAAVLQLLAIFTLSQFNLLQDKACDSPYVGKVCQVLDAAYLGSMMLGEDRDFVSRDYEQTELKQEDITYIDVSNAEPPLQYPEGYFANNSDYNDLSENFPSSSGDDYSFPMSNPSSTMMPPLDLNKPQILPTPNDKAANQKLPDSPFDVGDDPVMPKPRPSRVTPYRPPASRFPSSVKLPTSKDAKNTPPVKTPDTDKQETANANTNANSNPKQETAKTDANTASNPPANAGDPVGFNQKPLKDFGQKYGEQILNKSININAPFVIIISATLDAQGKLTDPHMTTTTNSDPQMTKVAQEAILAFGDSQLLKPLYDVGGRKVAITFSQNNDNLQAIIQAETTSENQAKLLQSGLNLYLKNFFKPKDGSDEQVLMQKATLATQGKNFIINFLINNDEKNQMIEKSLKTLKQELEQKKATQPTSVASNNDKNAKG